MAGTTSCDRKFIPVHFDVSLTLHLSSIWFPSFLNGNLALICGVCAIDKCLFDSFFTTRIWIREFRDHALNNSSIETLLVTHNWYLASPIVRLLSSGQIDT